MTEFPLLLLARAQDALREAEGELEVAVWEARRAGVTWREIGQALGMHRQNAQRKFASICDQSHTPRSAQPVG